jgi:hypothetical protein
VICSARGGTRSSTLRQELVQLAGKIDWHFIDGKIAPRAAVQRQWSGATRFVIAFFAQAHSGMDDRWHEIRHGRIISRPTATWPPP